MASKHLIYCFVNSRNHKKYIGQSVNLQKRLIRHIWESKNSDLPFYRALRKYGLKIFQFFVLEQNLPNIKISNEREKFWIDYFKSNQYKYGYNLTVGGEGILGFKHKDFTKRKIGNANRNHNISEETRTKMRTSHLGNTSHLGIQHTKETRQKMSANHWDCSGEKNPSSKKWKVIFPNKVEKILNDLVGFCKTNHINPSSARMSALRDSQMRNGLKFVCL